VWDTRPLFLCTGGFSRRMRRYDADMGIQNLLYLKFEFAFEQGMKIQKAMPKLPNPLNPIRIEKCFIADDNQPVRKCLSNKHSIKRIAMNIRQGFDFKTWSGAMGSKSKPLAESLGMI
jgi:hypothetical protein